MMAYGYADWTQRAMTPIPVLMPHLGNVILTFGPDTPSHVDETTVIEYTVPEGFKIYLTWLVVSSQYGGVGLVKLYKDDQLLAVSYVSNTAVLPVQGVFTEGKVIKVTLLAMAQNLYFAGYLLGIAEGGTVTASAQEASEQGTITAFG